MKPIHIPIRNLMTEPEEAVEFMPMPREMATFEMPSLPEPGPDHDVAGARDVLHSFLGHFARWLAQGGEPPALDLLGLAPRRTACAERDAGRRRRGRAGAGR